MFRRSLLAAFGLLLSASALTAQTSNSAPAAAASEAGAQEKMEEVQLGDHWTYEFRDDITGDVNWVATTTVTDLTDSQIGLRITRAGNTNSGYQTFDHSWNLINSGIWRYALMTALAFGRR